MKSRERKFVLVLALFALLSAVAVGGYFATKKYRQWQEERWRYVARREIELLEPIKTPPVLVLNGTVDGREFEIVMRGFTNYFRKETWGAPKGQRGLLGGQKPGGYAVEIRTSNFNGQRQQGWRGTHGGGGGGGFEAYRDDLLPGRNLWSSRGFVGLRQEYERHDYVWNQQFHFMRWEEDCDGWIQEGEIRVPRKMIWKQSGRDYSSKWTRPTREFMVRSFKFQDEPATGWFEARVKEYFPPQWIFKTTNAEPESVTGSATNK